MNICVYGASSTTIEQYYIDAGEKLGEEMAKEVSDLFSEGVQTDSWVRPPEANTALAEK